MDAEYVGDINEITFSRRYILKNIDTSKDTLLKIQAEALEDDYTTYQANKTATHAMFFSGLGIMIQLMPNINEMVEGIIKLGYLLCVVYYIVKCGLTEQFKAVRKWRKYILAVCEELLQEESKNNIEK